MSKITRAEGRDPPPPQKNAATQPEKFNVNCQLYQQTCIAWFDPQAKKNKKKKRTSVGGADDLPEGITELENNPSVVVRMRSIEIILGHLHGQKAGLAQWRIHIEDDADTHRRRLPGEDGEQKQGIEEDDEEEEVVFHVNYGVNGIWFGARASGDVY